MRGDVQASEGMRVIDASDSSMLVVFGDEISRDLNRRVIQLFHDLQESDLQKSAGPRIRNLHPAYASLLIDYDPLLLPPASKATAPICTLSRPLLLKAKSHRLVPPPADLSTVPRL